MTLTDPVDRAFLEIAQRDWDETLHQSLLVQNFPKTSHAGEGTRHCNTGFAPTKAGGTLEMSASESLIRWPIHIINPVDKTKLSCNTPTDAAPQFL